MTEQEKKVLNLTANLWNEFLQLETIHPSDRPDVMFHIHAIQNIIFAREGQRTMDCIIVIPEQEDSTPSHKPTQ